MSDENYYTGVLRLNNSERWCVIHPDTREDLREITSGEIFEVLNENNDWKPTRMEFDGHKKQYYSIDGSELYKDRPARIRKF